VERAEASYARVGSHLADGGAITKPAPLDPRRAARYTGDKIGRLDTNRLEEGGGGSMVFWHVQSQRILANVSGYPVEVVIIGLVSIIRMGQKVPQRWACTTTSVAITTLRLCPRAKFKSYLTLSLEVSRTVSSSLVEGMRNDRVTLGWHTCRHLSLILLRLFSPGVLSLLVSPLCMQPPRSTMNLFCGAHTHTTQGAWGDHLL